MEKDIRLDAFYVQTVIKSIYEEDISDDVAELISIFAKATCLDWEKFEKIVRSVKGMKQ